MHARPARNSSPAHIRVLIHGHARRERCAVQLDVQIPRARDLHCTQIVIAQPLQLRLRPARSPAEPSSTASPARTRRSASPELDLRRLLYGKRLHLHVILHAKDLLYPSKDLFVRCDTRSHLSINRHPERLAKDPRICFYCCTTVQRMKGPLSFAFTLARSLLQYLPPAVRLDSSARPPPLSHAHSSLAHPQPPSIISFTSNS